MAPYSQVSKEISGDADDHEALLAEDDVPLINKHKHLINDRWRTAVSLVIAASLGVAIGLATGYGWFGSTDTGCVRRMTQSTPMLKDLSINYDTVPFNGTFMTENIYRRPGSPQVDAAWEALGVNYRSVRIPVEDREAAGISPHHVQIDPKYGGGFPANVEGLHHLHCLNLVRQSLYYNYPYYKELGKYAFVNEEHILHLHVSHCLDIIRQQLMCTADVGVFGQVWYRPLGEKGIESFVDFNTNHKCRNYEDIRRWAEVRQLPKDVPKDFLMPPGPEVKIHDGVP